MLQKINITTSEIRTEIIGSYKHDIGVLYFCKNLVISEINEGEHVDMNTATLLIEAINLFFNEDTKYGYISNRINNFSVSPLDFSNFADFLKNISCYCTITYDDFNEENTNLERRFCTLPYKNFNCVVEAFDWVETQLETNKNTINHYD